MRNERVQEERRGKQNFKCRHCFMINMLCKLCQEEDSLLLLIQQYDFAVLPQFVLGFNQEEKTQKENSLATFVVLQYSHTVPHFNDPKILLHHQL